MNDPKPKPEMSPPATHPHPVMIKPPKAVMPWEIAPVQIDELCRNSSVLGLNQLFADVVTLRDMYKKHEAPVVPKAVLPLLEVFGRHAGELGELVQETAARILCLGGKCLELGDPVAGATRIPPIRTGQETIHQISRFVHGHEIILNQSRPMARETSLYGDRDTSAFLVARVIKINERQVWYLFDHVTRQGP